MPKIHLTHPGIEKLTADRWPTDYWDEGLPGFGVRMHLNGRKTFEVCYVADRRRRRLMLGTYPTLSLVDARDRAREILAAVASGEDPQAEGKAATFAELADMYLELHAKREKQRWREDERIIRVDLLPHWRHREAKDIGRRDVIEILDGIVRRGSPTMQNRTKVLISTIYNFGIGCDVVDHNPCRSVPMPGKERRRDRVLSEEEIRAIWHALNQEEPIMAATFKMRLLTAQRGNIVLSMRWEQVNGEWWTFPAEMAMNGHAHRFPLSPQARTVLENVERLTGRAEWVFASPRRRGAHITAVQKAAGRIAKAAGVDFVPHDLRRTAATFMTSMGISRLVVGKLLNHVESGITKVYDRYSYDEEKRDALAAWGDRVETIVTRK